MRKILSIIIPTYNMENYLRKCLDSLIVPLDCMDMLDVLVINDGSKDMSSQIAQEYEKNFPKTFRVINKENGNYGSCVNRGVSEAKGKYIKVLDADDEFDNNFFRIFIDILQSIDVDLVLNERVFIDVHGAEKKGNTLGLIDGEHPIDSVSSMTVASKIQTHNVTYRTEKVRAMGYRQTEGIAYSDMEWVFAPMSNVEKIFVFREKLYKYRIGRVGQSVERENWKKHFSDVVTAVYSLINFYVNCDVDACHQKYLYNKLQVLFEQFYTSDKKEQTNYVKKFETYVKQVAPELYVNRYNWENPDGFRYAACWHNPIIYILGKLIKRGWESSMRDFDYACYTYIISPGIGVSLINKLRNCYILKNR